MIMSRDCMHLMFITTYRTLLRSMALCSIVFMEQFRLNGYNAATSLYDAMLPTFVIISKPPLPHGCPAHNL